MQYWLWKFLQDRTRQFAHLHQDDSSAAVCDYIERVNTSYSQLNHLPHLSVPDVFTLVSLMGLYLSAAYGHPKANKQRIAYVDDGHELTLASKFLPNPYISDSTDSDSADDDYDDDYEDAE